MRRRKFFLSLTGIPVLLASSLTPTSALTLSPLSSIGTANETELANLHSELAGQIRSWEAQLAAYPDHFSWTAHNELRHLYVGISEKRSMQHADAILVHSLMDGYILNILADWQIESDYQRAIVTLMNKAEQFPALVHLGAASLLKAGDICRDHNMIGQASQLYQKVLTVGLASWLPVPTLAPYRTLAQLRLSV